MSELRGGSDQKQLPVVALDEAILIRSGAGESDPVSEVINELDGYDARLLCQLPEHSVCRILVRLQGPLRQLRAGQGVIEDEDFWSAVALSDDAGTDLPYDPHR
jgi:hypothetical protein